MARTPKKAVKKVTKKPCDCPDGAVKTANDTIVGCPETVSVTIDVPMPSPCCPCHGLETGTTGFMWYDGAGNCQCFPFKETSAKYLKWDSNGPYWANS